MADFVVGIDHLLDGSDSDSDTDEEPNTASNEPIIDNEPIIIIPESDQIKKEISQQETQDLIITKEEFQPKDKQQQQTQEQDDDDKKEPEPIPVPLISEPQPAEKKKELTGIELLKATYDAHEREIQRRKSSLAHPSQKLKLKLKIGSEVYIFSASRKEWMDGIIKEIKGETLCISYNNNKKIKWYQSFASQIKFT